MSTALTIRLSEQQAKLVARAAAEEDRSRGSVIRRCIDKALAGRGEDPARRTTGED